MTPSLNHPDMSEDSSVGSFQRVDRVVEVEDDDSVIDKDATAAIPLLNLTMDSSVAMNAPKPRRSIRSFSCKLGVLLSALIFSMVLVGLCLEIQTVRTELEQFQKEYARHQERVAALIVFQAATFVWHQQYHNRLVDSLVKHSSETMEHGDRTVDETSKLVQDAQKQQQQWEFKFRKVTDEVTSLNRTLTELRSDAAACKRRALGSQTLQAELDPVPQLLMRDIWSDQEPKVVQALKILLAYARDESLENKKTFLGFGHASIVLVMARWIDSASVQRLCCQVLSTLPAALHKHAASVGALDSVLLAMKQFPNNEHLQEQALYTLHHLVAKNSGNMMRIVERLSGLPIILDSMRAFPDSAVAQFYGIRLLKVLGSKHQFVGAIIEAGGLGVLGDVYAQWRGTSDELERGVVELARTTLANLVSKST